MGLTPGTFRDIVIALKAKLDPASTKQLKAEFQQALNEGTNPAQATQNIGAIATATNALNTAVQALGRTFFIVFGVRAVYNFFAESISMFAKFDQKLQQSIAIMENVSVAMKKELSDTATQVSKELNLSATELAGAYYYLASAGLNAEQSLKALPIVALFAKAGLMELNEATELLTQSNSVLGYSSKDASKNLAGMVRIADVLTKAANDSQATIEQLAVALTTKAGNSLRLFHKDVEEGAAVLAVFANQGIRGSVAGERLDMFLRQATQAALKHKEAFKAYGIQIFDSNGQMRDMADIADDLTKAIGHLNDAGQVAALSQLGFQVRTVASAKALIGQGDAIRGYETSLRSASGYTKHVADVEMQTPIERWGQFKQKIEDVRREIGERLISALHDAGVKIGNEDDPTSVLGLLRRFSKWLLENKEGLSTMATGISYLLKIFDLFMSSMNMLADGLVVITGGPIFLLGEAFNLVTIAAAGALKVVGGFVKFVSGGYFHEIDDFANMLVTLQGKLDSFAMSAGRAALDAGKDFFKTGFSTGEPVFHHTPSNLTGNLSGKGGGRDDSKKGTDGALTPEEQKAAEARAKHIEELNDELNAMIARHTQTRVDDEDVQLNRLAEKYKATYGKDIPKAVLDGFAKIKQGIAEDGSVEQFRAQFDVFNRLGTSPQNLQEFMTRLHDQMGLVDKNSKAWSEYNIILERAIVLQKKMTVDSMGKQIAALRKEFDTVGWTGELVQNTRTVIASIEAQMAALDKDTDQWHDYNDQLTKAKDLLADLKKKLDEIKRQTGVASDDAGAKKAEEHLQRIGYIGDQVARRMVTSWGLFFKVLTDGTRKGADAFEMLGRGIVMAMVGGMGEFAEKRAQVNFLESAEEVAKGIAALSDPILAATASGHFIAAAKFAAIGTGWAALGAGAGMAADSITSYGAHGLPGAGNNPNIGSTGGGTEIHIHVDGVDPKNATHQDIVGSTLAEFQERTGMAVIVHKGNR